MRPLTAEERFAPTKEGVSNRLRNIVQQARDRQHRRFEGTPISCNAAISGGAIGDYCQFSEEGFSVYKEIINSSTTTTRSVDRLAKVARTISDIANEDQIQGEHVKEAAQFMPAFAGS